MGYTGEVKWCPEASRRGDANQPRRRAGRRAGEAKSPDKVLIQICWP
jgi:hypothetical protein